MTIDLGTELEMFRTRVRTWIDEHKHLAKDDTDIWAKELQAEGFLCPAWPVDFGGGGLSGVEISILTEEFRRAKVQRIFRGMGESLVGPSIILHGSEDQQATFLPRILGVLVAVAGVGWLTVLVPPLVTYLGTPLQVLGFVAEALLMLWLLVFGVSSQRWNEQAGVAS